MNTLKRHLSVANVLSCIALFIALSGGAYAATALPVNSVGSKQLKQGAVGTADIKNNAITGTKIRLSSIGKIPAATNADMSANASHAAAAAALDKLTYKTAAATAPATSAANVATATCDSGQHVVGGGVKLDSPGIGVVNDSYPDAGGTAWTAHVGNGSNGSSAAPFNFTVYAICTTVTSTG